MRLFWAKDRFTGFVLGRRADGAAPLAGGSIVKRAAICVLTLLLLSSVITVAQPSPAPITPAAASAVASGGSYTGADALHDIAVAIEVNLNAMKNSSGLAALGMYLVGFFFVANLIWSAVKGFFAGGGFFSGFLADLVPLFVATGVTVMFLDKDVGSLILASLGTIATALTGSPDASVASLINEAAVGTFSTLSNVWSVGGVTGSDSSLLGMMASLPAFLIKLVAVACTTFLIVLALCVFFATLVMSQVAAIIGLALAPMFVPFLMFKPGAFLFDGWLRFILGAGMMKVVGLMMLKVTNVVTATLAAISAKAVPATSGALAGLSVDMILYASMILLAGLAAYLMAQVPSLATGLISGTAGGAGFGGWSQIATKSMATRGILGGMSVGGGGQPGGGLSGTGGRPAYAGQGATNAMPNALKPAAAGAGRLASSVMGNRLAKRDRSAAVDGGARSVARNTSKMSEGTERAYQSYLERANVQQGQKWAASGQAGPPRPNITLTKPRRTIDPHS